MVVGARESRVYSVLGTGTSVLIANIPIATPLSPLVQNSLRGGGSRRDGGLVIGPICFTAWISAEERIQNQAWRNTVFRCRSSFCLTTTGWTFDSFGARPGLASNHDVMVGGLWGVRRIAIGSWIMTHKRWCIFRCFVYPGVEMPGLNRRVGFIRVPVEMVDCLEMSTFADVAREVGRIPEWLDTEWSSCGTRCYGIAVFPYSYKAAMTDVLTVLPPVMFRKDWDEYLTVGRV